MAKPWGRLQIYQNGEWARSYTLDQQVILIGRDPLGDVLLPHHTVSSRHAELRREDNGHVFLMDVASTNGTRLGERKLARNDPTIILDGQRFHIGPYEILFEADLTRPAPDQSPQAQRTTAASDPDAFVSASNSGGWVGFLGDSRELPESFDPRPYRAARIRGRRPTYDLPEPEPGTSSYLKYLPTLYQNDPFMGRFLQIFETLWEPMEQRQSHIHMYFDPGTCPAPLLPWFAGWLQMPINPNWPEARVRRLLRRAMFLYHLRGTKEGLVQLIEASTDCAVTISTDSKAPFVFRINVDVPAETGVNRSMLEEIIELHKPAWAGYSLHLRELPPVKAREARATGETPK